MCQIVFPKVPKAVILKHHTTFFYFNYLVFLERATWHIWPPMWCFQGSVLQFSQCFVVQSCLVTTVTAVIIVTTVTTVTTVTSVTTVTTVTTVNQCDVLRAAFFNSRDVFWLTGCMISYVERLHAFVCREVVCFLSLKLHDLFFWRLCDCVIFFVQRLLDFLYVKRLHDLLCE